MSFPRYPKYKASGVEWLGDVPEGWELVQYKQFVDIQNGSDHKLVEQSEGYPVFGSGGAFAYASEFLYDGESVLLGRKGTIDKPLYVTGRFWTVDTMYWTKIRTNTSGRYAYYLAVTIPFDYYSTNTALPSMTKGALNRHFVTRPPLAEQTVIATFLDRETAKIDELVAEQKRLMELLKEKRQAVISHAVTKGLNPNAKMKPSGVEWLGDVPEEWEVSRVKYHCAIKGRIGFRGYTTNDQVDEGKGALVFGATHITSEGKININEPVYLSWDKYYESPEIMVAPTNILIVQRGSTCGKVGFVAEDHGPATINPSLVLLKEFKCSPRLMFYFLSSNLVQGLLECVLGSTAIPMLSQEQIGDLALCMPPPDEQEHIIEVIEIQLRQIDTLTAEAQRAIGLLQERRTALISAAVTGQIDVRNINNSQGV